MQYQIVEWSRRYEVDERGREWVPGKRKRKGPLVFIRLKVHGRSQGTGWRKLLARAGRGRALMVFGLFCKLLEIAGDHERDERGRFEDSAGNGISFILSVPTRQVAFGLQVLADLHWIELVPVELGNLPGDSREIPEVPHPTNQPTNTTNQPTACARASGDGSVSEPVAVRSSPPVREPGHSPWALARQAVSAAFGKDPGIEAALTAIGNALLSDRPGLDQAAGTIRELVSEAKAKGTKPAAYFVGALQKRWPWLTSKGGKPDSGHLHGAVAKLAAQPPQRPKRGPRRP